MKEKNKTLIKGIILLMLVALIGTTYAYFAANITGNESTSTIVVTGGRMEIAYDNLSGTIEAYDIYPREDAWVTKNFTVTGNNTTDSDMGYELGLKVDNNTFTTNALSYSLTSTNTSNKGNVVETISNQVISGSEVSFGSGSFPKGEDMVHTYTFELFFKDTGEKQNDDQEANFAGHITIKSAIPYIEVTLTQELFEAVLMSKYTEEEIMSMLTVGPLIIPETATVEGTNIKITAIGDEMFRDLNEIAVEIVMPRSLRTIGANAFDASGITGLSLNEGLKTIGTESFANNPNLTGTLHIPESVTYIGDGAFAGTGITSANIPQNIEYLSGFTGINITGHLTIPSTTKTIGYGAFAQTNITGLTLNEGLESLGTSAFQLATNLTGTLTIPSTVKTIGESAFAGSGITGLTLNEGLESIGTGAFMDAANLTGTLTIPSTVKTIGKNAFNDSGITGLTLNEGLESIGEDAFISINYLTDTITIPSTVKSIGAYAFSDINITEINYPGSAEDWNLITIGDGAFPSDVTINYNYTGA